MADHQDEGPNRFLGLEEVDWQYIASHSLINMPLAFAIAVLAASIANRAA